MDDSLRREPIIEAFRSFSEPSKAFVMGAAVLNGRLIRFGVQMDAPAGVSQDAIEASARPVLDEWWQRKLAEESRHDHNQCGGLAADCTVCMIVGEAV